MLEVKALLQALRLRGHEVWFDEEQLATGLDWEQSIEKGLQWCDKVVLTMTPHSVRRPDGYCLNEIAKAMEQQKLIVPVLLVEVPNGAPTSICRIQYLDWRDAIPAAENADRFMHRLKRLCEAIEHDKLDFEGGQQRLQRHLQPLNYDGDIRLHVARFEGRSQRGRRTQSAATSSANGLVPSARVASSKPSKMTTQGLSGAGYCRASGPTSRVSKRVRASFF